MGLDIARAWKDEAYYLSLSEEERASLPGNPVGAIELTDADLGAVFGAYNSYGRSCVSNYCGNNTQFVCISVGVCSGGCTHALLCI